MLIVAICSTTGPGSGKTTYLKRHVQPHLPRATHMRFSDPIVSFLCDGLRCLHKRDRTAYESLKSETLLPASGTQPAILGRDFMIAAGEALRSALRPSFYADIMNERLNDPPGDVVIDDFRKIPELDMLVNRTVAHGDRLLIVNVTRPGASRCNDSEFSMWDLRTRVWAIDDPQRVRLLEVTWDGRGGYRSTYRMRGN